MAGYNREVSAVTHKPVRAGRFKQRRVGMLRIILLSVAIVITPSLAQAESIPEAVRRIDAKVQELERAGVGKPGPPGERGMRGPRGARGPKGKDARLDNLNLLEVGNGRGKMQLFSDPRSPNPDRGEVILRNKSGKTVAWIGEWGTAPQGGAYFSDVEGNRRVQIGLVRYRNVEVPDVGSLVIYNKSGARVARFGQFTDGNTAGAHFYDAKGSSRAVVGVDKAGNGFVVINGKNVHDYAEILEVATREGIGPGSVVAYDGKAGGIVPASAANARKVIGVISGAGGLRAGMVIGSRADGSRDLPVSMSGVIYVRVSAEAGAVEEGDLLVPSSVPGVGMRAVDPVAAAGIVFGKALESWSGAGAGLVRMLVMNR